MTEGAGMTERRRNAGAGGQTAAKRSWGGVLVREPHCELSRVLARPLGNPADVANVIPR